MQNSRFAVLTVLAVAALFSAPFAGANDGEDSPEMRGACKADIAKFCKDVEPGQGRIARCLKSHREELSAECKARGEHAKERAGELFEACKADAETHCKDVQPGGGRIITCLHAKREQLSEGCRSAMEASRPKRGRRK